MHQYVCVPFLGPAAVSRLLFRVCKGYHFTVKSQAWNLLPLAAANPVISICILFQRNLFTFFTGNTKLLLLLSGGRPWHPLEEGTKIVKWYSMSQFKKDLQCTAMYEQNQGNGYTVAAVHLVVTSVH